MGLLDVRVAISRPLAAVFGIYSQPDTWSWCSYIHNPRWERGNPWEEESRLAIEIDSPVSGVVDQVLTRFEPPSRVDFISHFGGVTLLSRVKFRALSETETEIQGQFEFVGTFSRIAGFAIEPAIEKNVRKFFADLKRECERSTPQNASRAAKPGAGS